MTPIDFDDPERLDEFRGASESEKQEGYVLWLLEALIDYHSATVELLQWLHTSQGELEPEQRAARVKVFSAKMREYRALAVNSDAILRWVTEHIDMPDGIEIRARKP